MNRDIELTEKIAAAATPQEIISVIAAVSDFLYTCNAGQISLFFSKGFSTLLSRVFGLNNFILSGQEKTPSWLDWASFDDTLYENLLVFLSPFGPLIKSILFVDRNSVIRVKFPVNRLPRWISYTLTRVQHCRIFSDLCPLFRVNEMPLGNHQIIIPVNVFECYMLYFAEYAVLKGNCKNYGVLQITDTWNYWFEDCYSSLLSFLGLRTKLPNKKNDIGLYTELLHRYLYIFVPMAELSAPVEFNDTLLFCSPTDDPSVSARAEFLVNVLVHYWLVNWDLSPLSMNQCNVIGVSFPYRNFSGIVRSSFGLGLGLMVALFVSYMNFGLIKVKHAGFVGDSGCNKFLGVGFLQPRQILSLNNYIQRPLYRYLLRNNMFWQFNYTFKDIPAVFLVWVDYLEPWKRSRKEFFLDDTESSTTTEKSSHFQYSPIWEDYVVSNYLFYTSLVMHFIRLAHKLLPTKAALVVPMVGKVIEILTSSEALIDLIKEVDVAFHSVSSARGTPGVSRFYKLAPQINEQLQDWEDKLRETDTMLNKDLKLFSADEDGGPQLLEVFIMRAKDELEKVSHDKRARICQWLAFVDSRLKFFVL